MNRSEVYWCLESGDASDERYQISAHVRDQEDETKI